MKLKRDLKLAGFIFLLMAFPILLLIGVFLFAGVSGRIENHRMQKEVSAYVLENREIWEQQSPEHDKLILYKCTGIVCAGVDYGYYYSADDTYNTYTGPDNQFRNGYREDGYPDDPTDWYFTAKICDHWYYYEIHDG